MPYMLGWSIDLSRHFHQMLAVMIINSVTHSVYSVLLAKRVCKLYTCAWLVVDFCVAALRRRRVTLKRVSQLA